MLDLLSLIGGAVTELPFGYSCSAEGMSSDIVSGTVEAKGNIRNYAGYIVLRAKITLKAQVVCARCGRKFDTVFSFDTEQKLTDKLENKDNDEFIILEDGMLNEEEFVRSNMILEMPVRFLCREDCKGLCPKCGHNLNESRCSCDTKEIDPRLSVLSKYFEKE
jgi:uncharacterized protein